jgi:hypothetical protein
LGEVGLDWFNDDASPDILPPLSERGDDYPRKGSVDLRVAKIRKTGEDPAPWDLTYENTDRNYFKPSHEALDGLCREVVGED